MKQLQMTAGETSLSLEMTHVLVCPAITATHMIITSLIISACVLTLAHPLHHIFMISLHFIVLLMTGAIMNSSDEGSAGAGLLE